MPGSAWASRGSSPGFASWITSGKRSPFLARSTGFIPDGPEDRRLNARASRFLLLLAAAVGFASFGYYYSRGLTTVALDTVAREHLRSLLGIDLSRAVFVAS